MGLLDHLLDGVFDNLFTGGRTDRKLQRLAEEGEQVRATIYAIKVVVKADSADEWYYGLDLVGSGGPLRATVRQTLMPDAWRAPLGGRVLARRLDGRVAIDWPATLREQGVEPTTGLLAGKTLKTTLEPGVQDGNVNAKRLREGVRAEAEVLASDPIDVMGMPTQNRRLELRLSAPGAAPAPVAAPALATATPGASRTVVLKREYVPPYALALAEVGRRLPVAVDPKKPERVTIDWPTAAERAAGLPAGAP